MTRLTIGIFSVGLAAVAACGDNLDTTSATVCGDGVVSGNEQCDDGNTASGDGCSATCTAEATPGTCGDGNVDVATEQCDDGNTTSGDGCSSTCRTETPIPRCGDGHVDSAETCDDGGTDSGDGCSSTCAVESGYMCTGEPSVCTVMAPADGTCAGAFPVVLSTHGSTLVGVGAGDTTNTTNQVPGGSCDSYTSSGGGHDQIWAITNPVAQPVLITIHHQATAFDAVLRLTTTACDVSTQVADDLLPDDQTDGESDGCADLHGTGTDERLHYANLPAGTYYLVVDGYGASSSGAYAFSVEAGTATCGNSVVEIGESCDDGATMPGDGCNDSCQTEQGYGCTGEPSTCTLVGGSCISPRALTLTMTGDNYDGMGTGDTTNALDNVAAAACDHESSAGGAHDEVWTFTNPVAQAVRVTVDGSSDFDAVLRVMTTGCDLASEVPETVPTSDTGATSDGCADRHTSGTSEVLTYRQLPAGTYYVLIDGYNTAATGMYSFSVHGEPSTCGNGVIELGETCDDGGASDGDGCSSACAVEAGFTCTGTPSVCTTPCGNGQLDSGEACDDGGHMAGDGCDPSCQIESGYGCYGVPSTCVLGGGTCAVPFPLVLTDDGGHYRATGTSNDSNSTDQVMAAACDIETTAGAAADHQWTFDNPVDQPVKITLTGSATSFDGLLRLMTTACDIASEVPDDDAGGTSDGCSDRHASGTSEVLTYNNLPAGTYYLDIDGYGATASGSYSFQIDAGSLCGNGAIDGTEECDSGGVTNDRCTADCHLVFDTAETEANDDAANAQVVSPDHHIIEGSLAVGDLDVFAFTLTAASSVSVETYTTYASSYPSTGSIPHLVCAATDTYASIFDGAGDVTDDTTSLYHDDDGGDGACSHVTTSAVLAPGTYYFVVHEYGLNAAVARYLVDFDVTAM